MAYTKQHYELVARVLRKNTDSSDSPHLAFAFAEEFFSANTNFDAVRFLRACGLPEADVQRWIREDV